MQSRFTPTIAAYLWVALGTALCGFVLLNLFKTFGAPLDIKGFSFGVAHKSSVGAAWLTSVFGSLALALLLHIAKMHCEDVSRNIVEDYHIPGVPLIEGKDKSATIRDWSTYPFIYFPWVGLLWCIAFVLVRPVVPMKSNMTLSDGALKSRIDAIQSQCAWWVDGCFWLADKEGLDYKPLLTDIAPIALWLFATWMLVRWRQCVQAASQRNDTESG